MRFKIAARVRQSATNSKWRWRQYI